MDAGAFFVIAIVAVAVVGSWMVHSRPRAGSSGDSGSRGSWFGGDGEGNDGDGGGDGGGD